MAVKIPSKLGSMSPTFQKAWYKRNKMPLPTHLTGSVKQASKEVKPSERVKKLQAKSIQAYGATKGQKVGGEHGSEDMRDTIAPLTRDQHSKVQAAERAAKAAAAKAAPKRTKPLSHSERMAAIAAAVRKGKAKHDVPTVDPDDTDHDDLRDVHNQMHIRGTYSEAVDRVALIKSIAAKKTMNKPMRLTKKPEALSKTIGRHKYVSHINDVTGYNVKSNEKGMNRFEEVESVEEAKKPLKPSYWRAEWRLGTKSEVDKNNKKIYDRLAQTDPDKAKKFHDNLMKLRKEEVESVEESVATAQKVMDRAKIVANTNPDPKKRFAASGLAQKAMLRTINPTGVNTGITRGGGNKTYRMVTGKVPPYQLTPKTGVSEEIEEINEIGNTERGVQRLRDYVASDRSKVKIKDVIAAKRSENPEKELNKLGMRQSFKAKAQKKIRAYDAAKNPKPKQEPIPMGLQVYPPDMKYHGDSVELEGPTMNEVTKKEAEAVLGGPTREKPKGPAGKHPLGYRLARSAARKAMRGAVGAVHKSMEKTMAKEEVEVVDEKVEIFHRQGPGADMERYHKDTSNPAAVLARKKAADAARTSRVAGDLKAKKMGQTMSTGNGGAVKAVSTTSQGFKKEEVEQVTEQDDSMEKKEMAQTQLHFMAYAAKEILEFIDMGGEIEEWYQNKLSKVQSEVESLHSYIEGEKRRTGMVKEEEQIDEKAPPGAKYERMVKHIKKGYAKDGLTKQEKGIAYATAWKAYGKKEEVEQTDEAVRIVDVERGLPRKSNVRVRPGSFSASDFRDRLAQAAKERRKITGEPGVKGFNKPIGFSPTKYMDTSYVRAMKKEEVEQVTEAEGTVAVTPKEKALAAHHGDKSKITYGDVIKARLKSVASKKMGKK